MYSFIATAQEGAWESREYELPRERFCQFTSPQLKERFEKLTPAAVDDLKDLPTLFAYDGMEHDVRIGYITAISDRGRSVFIEFDFDWRIPPIPFAKIQSVRARLDLGNRFELQTTHWAIKSESLLVVLATAGVIDPSFAGQELPRAALPLPNTWEKLGAGGFGSVYRVTDQRLGLDFALKVFDPSPFNTKHVDARERFLREAGLLFRLHHKHVIRIHDAGELAGGQPYIKMEYFVGKDLQRFSS